MTSREVAKKVVEEAIVLLKNEDDLLPFSKGQKISFFGRAQVDTICSGNGSGAAHKSECRNILTECEMRRICAEPGLKEYYMDRIVKEEVAKEDDFDWAEIGKAIHSGAMYEVFGKYHAPVEEDRISEKQMEAARQYTDTAILVIGRNSGGEECDRHLQGDYYLTDSEKILTKQVCRNFNKVVLILNINGLIDLSWVEEYRSIKSILFAGVLGEEGAAALADVLVGNVTPSGKLAFTIAKRYEDYPAASHFSWDKEKEENLLTYESYGLSSEENGSTGYAKSPVTVYWEDIYAGYRYFDTFEKEPLYAFGHGLSYTEFEVECLGAVKKQEGIEVRISARNIGNRVGKEVLQLYLASGSNLSRRACQELKGFEKTRLLHPGEKEDFCFLIPWREWTCYDDKQAAYVIWQGDYHILIGNSSRNIKNVVAVQVKQNILVWQCANRLGVQECNRGKLKFLTYPMETEKERYEKSTPEIIINPEDMRGNHFGGMLGSACDELENKVSRSDKVSQLSLQQLAALCVGYGPGTPFAAFIGGDEPDTIYTQDGEPVTTNSHPAGYKGYVSPAIEDKGIYSVFYKDGPAGIGEMAWPTEMLMACAFNKKIWYEFGNAVGAECEKEQVDIWLAPAVNLHRHPLGGRNFEYFSEDPYLTGICACEVTKGVQENHPVLVCPKHFAVNEQETFRRGNSAKGYDAVDSIISERAVRELYLKPFEMLVKEAGIACLMTSFNKINGVFTAGNADLCTYILREEWGYQGAVVTAWGDVD
ncbi:MAG: glycoside hydrolase family 3 C-terminal domain-containing protein, partial [Lachnospiraceae bacterium]|nr:glycoside hydrolase family 3 C-terminal domain-containing protein [Lachnospiraceae bacterium]